MLIFKVDERETLNDAYATYIEGDYDDAMHFLTFAEAGFPKRILSYDAESQKMYDLAKERKSVQYQVVAVLRAATKGLKATYAKAIDPTAMPVIPFFGIMEEKLPPEYRVKAPKAKDPLKKHGSDKRRRHDEIRRVNERKSEEKRKARI